VNDAGWLWLSRSLVATKPSPGWSRTLSTRSSARQTGRRRKKMKRGWIKTPAPERGVSTPSGQLLLPRFPEATLASSAAGALTRPSLKPGNAKRQTGRRCLGWPSSSEPALTDLSGSRVQIRRFMWALDRRISFEHYPFTVIKLYMHRNRKPSGGEDVKSTPIGHWKEKNSTTVHSTLVWCFCLLDHRPGQSSEQQASSWHLQ
jgi:hypothetical protein